MLPSCHLSTSLTSKRLSRHSLVQILQGSIKKCPDAATVFNDFTSQPLSCHSMVQILPTWPSKSAPIMPSFNEFDFQTARSPQPGANLAACDFKKPSDHASFWRFVFPNYSFAPSWAAGLSRPPVFGSCLCKPAAATQLWTNVAFRSVPTRQNDRVSHVCAVSSLRDHIFCWRIFGGNALYSRKLDSYISIHFLFESSSSIWCKSIGCRICMSFVAGLPCIPTFRVPSSQVYYYI